MLNPEDMPKASISILLAITPQPARGACRYAASQAHHATNRTTVLEHLKHNLMLAVALCSSAHEDACQMQNPARYISDQYTSLDSLPMLREATLFFEEIRLRLASRT
jgi:pyruvate formate-lyase activating enzyme-like uncharacterized protein